MRSSFSFSRSLSATAAVVGLALVAACSDAESTAGFDGDSSPGGGNADGGNGGGSFSDDDGATVKSGVFTGNPLCRVDPSAQCMPDQPNDCGPNAHDAGADDAGPADAGPTGSACRLRRDEKTNAIEPTCRPASYGGADGAPCGSGDQCAPGFDCVDAEKGPVCRKYCCLGTCGDASANGGSTFCDIQRLVDTASEAPVCMPLKPCKLMTQGQCAPTETCAVVNDNGDTGCVAVGTANVGDTCDDKHCDVGLTCLGQPGNRKCRALCRVGSSSCGATQVCKTTSAFKDSLFGICQDP